jgi:hypothetical protein
VASDDAVEVNRAGIGLAIAGAALLVIAVFLPWAEATKFSSVGQNTLIQSGDGWLVIGIAVVIAASLYRTIQRQAKTWSILVLGLIAIGLAVYDGTGDRLTLQSVDAGSGNIITEKANPGIGIYATGAGGALAVFGGFLLAGWGIWPGGAQLPARRMKQCPECAETVLADAKVCKHCGNRFPTPTE